MTGNIIEALQEKEPNKYVCPLSNETVFICQEDQQCDVDCANPMQFGRDSPFLCSSHSLIDASMAESVTIDCGADNASCSDLKILCPSFDDTYSNYCQLNCHQNGSCSNVEVRTFRSKNVFVECMEDGSCSNLS